MAKQVQASCKELSVPENLDLFAKSNEPSNNNDNAQVYSTRSYALNINRALRHKIDSCDKVNVEYEVTGGGIRGSMDTGTFELFRLACSAFYKGLPTSEGRSVIDCSEDRHRRAIVQQTYKVERPYNGEQLGYTLNLYTTKNKLLLNGKDIDQFMDRHLPIIHEIMLKPIRDGQLRSVSHFNEILSSQINKVLQQRQAQKQPTDVNTNGEASLSQLPETAESADNIQCPRCRKNCYRRSAFCEIGSHWIHYGCDKLSESDIQRLTNDKGFIYNCKRCAASENTLRKHPVGTTSPREVIGPDTHKNGKQLPGALNKPVPNQQFVVGDIINQTSADVDSGVIMPDIQVKNKDCRTQAEAILDDENDATCAVCLGNIIETPNRCSKCLSMCHDSCLAATDADTDASICLTCHATEAQIKHGEEIQGAHINRDADTTLVPRQASSVSCSSGDKTQVKDGAEDGMTLKFQESSHCTNKNQECTSSVQGGQR